MLDTGTDSIMSATGILDFTRGVVNGTGLITNQTRLHICSDTIEVRYIQGAVLLANHTLEIEIFDALYKLYDMLYYGHLTATTCSQSAVSAAFVMVESFNDLSDIKRILDNIVHNFGLMYVTAIDIADYFSASETGQEL